MTVVITVERTIVPGQSGAEAGRRGGGNGARPSAPGWRGEPPKPLLPGSIRRHEQRYGGDPAARTRHGTAAGPLGLLAAVAILSTHRDGLTFWLGALTGTVAVLGYLACFDSPRGIWQWLPAVVGFCAAFLFAGQLLTALLT